MTVRVTNGYMAGNLGKKVSAIALALSLGVLSACSGANNETNYPTTIGRGPNNPNPDPNAPRDSIFGEDGLTLFGGGADAQPGGGGIGVNSFLWRASLDTLSFVPLASADPFGGVIISEWYSAAQSPNERFKLTVYILDRRLRADGLRVAVFRQQRDGADWRDTPADPQTAVQLENAILMRARELRVNTLEAAE